MSTGDSMLKTVPVLALLVLAACASETKIYSEEPPLGDLKVGEVILVDDGTCPAGQILQVSAADRSVAQQRTRVCVARP